MLLFSEFGDGQSAPSEVLHLDLFYDDEGRLVNRRLPGALVTDLKEVEARIHQFLNDGTFTSQSGKRVEFDAQCVLVHSDTPGAVEIARVVRNTVEKGGGKIVPLTELAN